MSFDNNVKLLEGYFGKRPNEVKCRASKIGGVKCRIVKIGWVKYQKVKLNRVKRGTIKIGE